MDGQHSHRISLISIPSGGGSSWILSSLKMVWLESANWILQHPRTSVIPGKGHGFVAGTKELCK